MITEIDLLKEDIPRLEEKFGEDNLFVEVLKAQLASLQGSNEQRTVNEVNYPRFLTFARLLSRGKSHAVSEEL